MVSSTLVSLVYLFVVIAFRWYTHECGIDVQTLRILGVSVVVWVLFEVTGEKMFTLDVLVAIVLSIWTYISLIRGKRHADVDMRGKTVIITGSNTGIGLETARELARMGARVILACRTKSKAVAAVEKIKASTGTESVTWMQLDLCSWDSIRNFAKKFKEQKIKLHVLINNAGMMCHDRRITKEGYEMTLAANHLGPFLLTRLLLDSLKQGEGGRIVNVSSALHFLPKSFNFADINLEEGYEMFSAYGRSKLAGMLFTMELDRRLKGESSNVTVNALHPGLVLTEVTRHMHWTLRYLELIALPLNYPIRKTASQGAFTSIHVASSPSLKGIGGKYFVHCEAVPPSLPSLNKAAAKRIWDVSARAVGLKD